MPGITTLELESRLDLSPTTIRRHVGALRRKALLSVETNNGRDHFFRRSEQVPSQEAQRHHLALRAPDVRLVYRDLLQEGTTCSRIADRLAMDWDRTYRCLEVLAEYGLANRLDRSLWTRIDTAAIQTVLALYQ